MKYLKPLQILIALFFIFSCNKEISTGHLIVINNYSSHKIEIPTPDTGDNLLRTTLESNKSYSYDFSERGNQPKFIGIIHGFLNDSAKIIFNDTLTIYHGSNQYSIKRDIRMVNSYEYEGIGNDHNYTYTFTNADFREADSIIN
tara:strand:- start:235 stop:666 length:432 start_codon:yes stop_codon:yes gene_type:complete